MGRTQCHRGAQIDYEVQARFGETYTNRGTGKWRRRLFDYRNGSEPSVVMLDHEILTKQQEPTHPLAESFEKLMAGWYKDDKSRVRRFLRVVDE